MKPSMKHLKSTACAIAIVLSMLVGNTQAQQFPNPTDRRRKFPVPQRATR